MKIKKYIAHNLQFAIRKIKAELGKEAIILNTKRRKKGGFLGLFGREIIEITAAAPAPVITPARPLPPPRPPVSGSQPETLTTLQEELGEIKAMIAGLNKESPQRVDSHLAGAYRLLTSFNNLLVLNDVTAENATTLIKKVINILPEKELWDYKRVKETLLGVLAADLQAAIPTAPDSGQQVVALVGPTGVGKTTTIAKLAAKASLLQNRTVALITADTYRIAAVEQLRRYAEIINVPLEVVLETNDLQDALHRHREKNLILIDTAGRSQRNIVQISELQNILEAAAQIETLLVLSLTTKYRDLLDITTKFRKVNYDALLFTKLDETTSYGSIFNLVRATGKPLTYITMGQNVPDDIETVKPMKIAKMILGET